MIQSYLFEEVASGEYSQRQKAQRAIDAALTGSTVPTEPAMNERG